MKLLPVYVGNYNKNGAFYDMKLNMASCKYSVRNLENAIRFSLKSWPSERFHWPEMSQIKADIRLRTNLKLIFHKNVGWQ